MLSLTYKHKAYQMQQVVGSPTSRNPVINFYLVLICLYFVGNGSLYICASAFPQAPISHTSICCTTRPSPASSFPPSKCRCAVMAEE